MQPMRLVRVRILPPDPDIGWTPFAWLIYFPTLFVWPALHHAGARTWGLTIAGGAIFLPLYFRWFWCRNWGEKYATIGVIAVLGMVLTPLNPGAPVFTIYATSFAGWVRPARRAVTVIAVVVGCAFLEAMLLHIPASVWTWQVGIGIVVGVTNTHFAKIRVTNVALRRAHEEIEHLAKVAERERIARDLHDLLGHTLSLITLKAALASRLADRDPARAATEIRDVERISREALTEVRAAVAGYRDTGLPKQLSSAELMLQAAGIDMHASIGHITLAPAEEAVLSLVLREAVTNVVRHARAKRCEITVSECDGTRVLCIADDGRGKRSPDGNGVRGMRERVSVLGGTLAIESSRGTRVRVTLGAPPGVLASVTVPRPTPMSA